MKRRTPELLARGVAAVLILLGGTACGADNSSFETGILPCAELNDPRIHALAAKILQIYGAAEHVGSETSVGDQVTLTTTANAAGGKTVSLLEELPTAGEPKPQDADQLGFIVTSNDQQETTTIKLYQYADGWDVYWLRGANGDRDIGCINGLPHGNLAPAGGTPAQGRHLVDQILHQAELLAAFTPDTTVPPLPQPQL